MDRDPVREALGILDGGDGVEPSFRESKSRVLPLNEPPGAGTAGGLRTASARRRASESPAGSSRFSSGGDANGNREVPNQLSPMLMHDPTRGSGRWVRRNRDPFSGGVSASREGRPLGLVQETAAFLGAEVLAPVDHHRSAASAGSAAPVGTRFALVTDDGHHGMLLSTGLYQGCPIMKCGICSVKQVFFRVFFFKFRKRSRRYRIPHQSRRAYR